MTLEPGTLNGAPVLGLTSLPAPARVIRADLRVDAKFADFVEQECLRDTEISSETFWAGVSALLAEFAPRNEKLLARRRMLQHQIDTWLSGLRAAGRTPSGDEQEHFLRQIGYIEPDGDAFSISVTDNDPEIALVAGPQLVTPLSNARYALNAVNARWGSLYDALYGTDAIAKTEESQSTFDPARGRAVIDYGRAFLDRIAPLNVGQHAKVTHYWAEPSGLRVALKNGAVTTLREPASFRGFRGAANAPGVILLRHNGLHVEIIIDRTNHIGRDDPAGVADIQLEAALTVIMDLEDSVAAVDAADKIELYRSMFGLARGTLTATFGKNGQTQTRSLLEDRIYTGTGKDPLQLPGRSLILYRNVGHLMTTGAVVLPNGQEAPEGIIDGALTALIAVLDRSGKTRFRNSKMGATYIVKPKMHGSEEAAFANDLFNALEDMVGLPRHTIKIGVMDEERRTSVNLKQCIRAVKDRIFFINTGFLDRTGDEIHTNMQAGPVVPKGRMRAARWLGAYENRNVLVGLAAGFSGKAQIGKGMWAMPDRMAEMLATKIAHPRAGANAAWVPSPTAAVLHALHYHEADVAAIQAALTAPAPTLSELVTPPIAQPADWANTDVHAEIENNCQSILGYVVRWIDQGIGCSKVPDIHDVGLMEDRATLRISSQLLANWMLHGICQAGEVETALRRVALVVDRQNADDPFYTPMSANLDENIAFGCARALIFQALHQPNGYTEPLLHRFRQMYKAQNRPSDG